MVEITNAGWISVKSKPRESDAEKMIGWRDILSRTVYANNFANNIVLIGLCVAVSSVSAQTSPHALSAEVTHSATLPPLKGAIKIGQPLPNDGKDSATNGRWFEIPRWLGGTWRSIQVVRLSSYDEESGETESKATVVPAREKETLGFQLDRNNNVWTCASNIEPISYSTILKQTNSDGAEEEIPGFVQISRENQFVDSSTDRVTLKSTDVVITFRKDNRIVHRLDRRELLRTFVRLNPTLIAVYSDVQTYDVFGYPQTKELTTEFRRRERDFRVQDDFKGISLHSSFSKFLKSSGKLGLVPDQE
ncbi:MAG: hypothetical protein K2Y39_14090 [Candidatus Obscuribacterales bacterium]|nr:hypothetical protein [Candidatus Obscuribacterales bacterium]